MADAITQARVAENGASAYAVTITVSGHTLSGDEPISFGGGDTGAAPYDLLTASLGECTAMTVRWYAKQQNWPLDKVEVVVTHRKESIEGSQKKTDVFEKSITLHGGALSDEQRRKLVEVSAKCPIQRTLEGSPIIRTV